MNLHIDQISDFPKNIKKIFGISAFFVCHSPRFLKASTKAFSKLYTARNKRNDTQYWNITKFGTQVENIVI